MFIHRENVLKAHQYTCISYSSIQRDHFKNTILIQNLITLKKKFMQNLIKIFTKTHQIVHFFKKFS